MAISFMHYNSYSFGGKGIGERWSPKAQRLYVGRDVCAIQNTTEQKDELKAIRLEDTTKRLMKKMGEMGAAQSKTSLGFMLNSVADFGKAEQLLSRGVPSESINLDATLEAGNVTNFNKPEDVYLTYQGGKAMLRIAGAEGERLVEVTEDMRISWNKNGQVEVDSGGAALENGKLKARGKYEILIRVSGVDVEAGENSTVLNLGAKGGSFGGGSNVRYLGAYSGASIEGGSGSSEFLGDFQNSKIDSSKGQAEFSGTFGGGNISSGVQANTFAGFYSDVEIIDASSKGSNFSGDFMNNCSLVAGDGENTFNGDFIDTSIKAGNGGNIFGTKIDSQTAIEVNFLRCSIESGSGQDTLIGFAEQSQINLGDGDDTVCGILRGSTVEAGEGNDRLELLYAKASVVDAGADDDEVRLFSGQGNNVKLGKGKNFMSSGLNEDDTQADNPYGFSKSVWVDEGVPDILKFALRFGEVDATKVDASEGENEISVHDGENVHQLRSWSKPMEEDKPAEKTADQENKPESSQEPLAELEKKEERPVEAAKDLLDKLEEQEDSPVEEAERFFSLTSSGMLKQSGILSLSVDIGNGQDVVFNRKDRFALKDRYARMAKEAEDENILRNSLKLRKPRPRAINTWF